jgi:hypothetical protein
MRGGACVVGSGAWDSAPRGAHTGAASSVHRECDGDAPSNFTSWLVRIPPTGTKDSGFSASVFRACVQTCVDTCSNACTRISCMANSTCDDNNLNPDLSFTSPDQVWNQWLTSFYWALTMLMKMPMVGVREPIAPSLAAATTATPAVHDRLRVALLCRRPAPAPCGARMAVWPAIHSSTSGPIDACARPRRDRRRGRASACACVTPQPDTTTEKVYSCFIVVIGAIFFALLLGQVTGLILVLVKAGAQLRDQLVTIATFASSRRVPSKMAVQLKTHLSAEWTVTKGMDTQAILADFPLQLRGDVLSAVFSLLIECNPPFLRCSERARGTGHTLTARCARALVPLVPTTVPCASNVRERVFSRVRDRRLSSRARAELRRQLMALLKPGVALKKQKLIAGRQFGATIYILMKGTLQVSPAPDEAVEKEAEESTKRRRNQAMSMGKAEMKRQLTRMNTKSCARAACAETACAASRAQHTACVPSCACGARRRDRRLVG